MLTDFFSILLELKFLSLCSIHAYDNRGKRVLPCNRRSPSSHHDLEEAPYVVHGSPTVPLQQAALLLAPLMAPAHLARPSQGNRDHDGVIRHVYIGEKRTFLILIEMLVRIH